MEHVHLITGALDHILLPLAVADDTPARPRARPGAGPWVGQSGQTPCIELGAVFGIDVLDLDVEPGRRWVIHRQGPP